MKKLHIIYIALLMLVMTGCTHNNGDIDHWFGMWKVESITVDGKTLDSYEGNFFFSFQTSIFSITKGVGENGYQFYGEWKETSENTIHLKMANNDHVPSGIYFELEQDFHYTVSSGDKLTMEKTTGDGHVVAYHLKKW